MKEGQVHKHEMTSGLIHECVIKPMMENLTSYGFQLEQILHPVPAEEFFPEFKNAWVLADTWSPKWALVGGLFLVDRKGAIASEDEIGKALGYPVDNPERRIRYDLVNYFDPTEGKLLWNALKTAFNDKTPPHLNDDFNAIIRRIGSGYLYPTSPETRESDVGAVRKHYMRCEKAAKDVGWKIKIEFMERIREYPYWNLGSEFEAAYLRAKSHPI